MSKIIGDDIDQMLKVLENIRMALHEHREFLELPDIGNSFQIVNCVNRSLTAARNLSLELSQYKKASHGIVMAESVKRPDQTEDLNGPTF